MRVIRIALLGNEGCGKTTWLERLETGEFIRVYAHTEKPKTYKIEDNCGKVKYEITEIPSDVFRESNEDWPETIDAALIGTHSCSWISQARGKYWEKRAKAKWGENLKVLYIDFLHEKGETLCGMVGVPVNIRTSDDIWEPLHLVTKTLHI